MSNKELGKFCIVSGSVSALIGILGLLNIRRKVITGGINKESGAYIAGKGKLWIAIVFGSVLILFGALLLMK